MEKTLVQSERQDVKRKFDFEQPRWEEIYHKADYHSRGFQWRQGKAVALCVSHVSPGGWILDLGCGCGNASTTLAQLGFRVLGVDISEPMIAQATRNAALMGVEDCRFELYDFAQEHPGAGRFDGLVALGFIEYFDDPVWVLKRMRDLLRPGGIATVQVWNRRPWADTMLTPSYQIGHAVGHPIDSLKELAKAVLPRTVVERLQSAKPARPSVREPNHRRYTPREFHTAAAAAGFQMIDARASRYFPYRFFFANERRVRWDEQLQKWAEHKRLVREGAIDYVAALKKV